MTRHRCRAVDRGPRSRRRSSRRLGANRESPNSAFTASLVWRSTYANSTASASNHRGEEVPLLARERLAVLGIRRLDQRAGRVGRDHVTVGDRVPPHRGDNRRAERVAGVLDIAAHQPAIEAHALVRTRTARAPADPSASSRGPARRRGGDDRGREAGSAGVDGAGPLESAHLAHRALASQQPRCPSPGPPGGVYPAVTSSPPDHLPTPCASAVALRSSARPFVRSARVGADRDTPRSSRRC